MPLNGVYITNTSTLHVSIISCSAILLFIYTVTFSFYANLYNKQYSCNKDGCHLNSDTSMPTGHDIRMN